MATKELTPFKQPPFINTGKAVWGKDRFVGRKEIIDWIKKNIVESSINVSLVGLHKIGKSSIVKQCLIDDPQPLYKKKIVPVFYTLTSKMDVFHFYYGLLREIIKSLKESNLLSEEDINEIEDYRKQYENTNEIYEIEDFIDYICKIEIKLIIILDEFDAAAKIFKDTDEFENLRKLCYEGKRPNYISYLTTSRRSIEKIEKNTLSGSTFYQLFSAGEKSIKSYNEEDLNLYWQRINKLVKPKYKEALTKEIISYINVISGSQPYLLDLVNNALLPNLLTNGAVSASMDEVEIKLEKMFDYYEKIIEDEELLDAATEILLGPVTSEGIRNLKRLEAYDFVQAVSPEFKSALLHADMGYKNEKGDVYICISQQFTKYYYDKHRFDENRLLPSYGKLLKALKDLIITYFIDNYGEAWENNEQSYNIKTLRSMRGQDIKKHITPNPHLGPYINETIIRNVIFNDDYPFKKIFTKDDYSLYIEKLKWVCDIRNHYAHDNTDALTAVEIKKTQEYCESLLKCISDWQMKPTSMKSAYPV